MAELGKKLKEIKNNNKKAFVVYLCGGDPEEKLFLKIVKTLEKYADVLEVGIPFTDSVADGKVIQESIKRSFENNTTPNTVLTLCKKIRDISDISIVIMTSLNIAYRRGVDRFIEDALRTGIKGLILPDLSIEESEEYCNLAKDRLDTIFLAAPTSGEDRLKKISELSTGFIYYVAVKGTTGIRETSDVHIKEKLSALKKITDKPVYAGFGISSPQNAKEISRYADGVIIGSKIIKIISENIKQGSDSVIYNIEKFASSIRESIDG